MSIQGSLMSRLREALKSTKTKGMDDSVPAMVMGSQGEPRGMAKISNGEYIVPADVVSMLGDGNTEAGAKVLDRFIESIRKMKTGDKKQAPSMDSGITKLLNLEG